MKIHRSLRNPFLLCLAAFAGFATLLAVADDGGQPLELVLLLAAVAAAYSFGWPTGLVAGTAAVGYGVVEIAGGRLTFDAYWKHAIAIAIAVAAVTAASAARRLREEDAGILEQSVAEIQELRSEDELEQLLAGGRALTSLEQELLRSKRHAHAAGMLLVRPDGIEDVSAREGPAGAHLVLRAVAASLGRHLRTSDVSYRNGPFDLCVLLPETELGGARVAAERLRLAVGSETAATISVGAATFPAATSQEALLSAAREALEEARRQGGNRTVLHALPVAAPPGWALPSVTRSRD